MFDKKVNWFRSRVSGNEHTFLEDFFESWYNSVFFLYCFIYFLLVVRYQASCSTPIYISLGNIQMDVHIEKFLLGETRFLLGILAETVSDWGGSTKKKNCLNKHHISFIAYSVCVGSPQGTDSKRSNQTNRVFLLKLKHMECIFFCLKNKNIRSVFRGKDIFSLIDFSNLDFVFLKKMPGGNWKGNNTKWSQ